MKKLLALLATLAMVLGVSTFLTPSLGSAHVPSISASCEGVTVSGTNYDGSKTNTWSVTVGGVDHSGTFGSSFSETIPVPQGGATTAWSAHVQAFDGGYSASDSGTVGPCGTVPQPPDDVQYRDITDEPNCTTHEVVTEHQSRHIPYVLVDGQWVPGTPGDWKTDSTTSRITTHDECSTGTQPPNDTQTRDVVDSPDCQVFTVTTEHQSRFRTYSFNDASWSWVPGEWSAWHTDSSDTRDATLTECPAPPQPPAIVQSSDRSKYECGDDFTTVTTTTVTTPYVLDVPTRTWVLGTPVTSTEVHKVSVDKVDCPTTTVIKHKAKTIVTGSLPGTGGPSLLIGLAAFIAIGVGAATLRISRKS